MRGVGRKLRTLPTGIPKVAAMIDRVGGRACAQRTAALPRKERAQRRARRTKPRGFDPGFGERLRRQEKRTRHGFDFRLYASRLDNRIDILKQMLAADPANSFARYGLAMEQIKGGDLSGAVEDFRALLERDPNYSAGYFHGRQTLEKLGRFDDARDFYRRGLAVTRDPHARGELQAALDILGE